jgi:hypothetical protein
VLCEWDILGRSEQEVYVWAACRAREGDDSRPAVIRLGMDGAIQEVVVLKRITYSNVDRLFPKEVQEKFSFYIGTSIFDGRLREMYNHLIYRKTHPETPPLVVLSYIPVATPIPTPLSAPILTPDAIQVERWQEYQTELAKTIFPNDPPEWFLCEWVILGRSDPKVYAWAVCGIGIRTGSVPVVISLNPDGSIQNVEKPKSWTVENIEKMFPEDVRNKFNYMESGETQKMLEHLDWRWLHTGEPPLIILSATPVPSPTP